MLQGFKNFVMRGNVVDLAVAFVIGLAFAALVNTVVSSIITPLLNAFSGGGVGGLGFHLISDNPATYIDLAAILNAIIVFLLTAAVVYFLIVAPMNKVNERRRAGVEAPAEDTAEDVVLLREIRDLLTHRSAP